MEDLYLVLLGATVIGIPVGMIIEAFTGIIEKLTEKLVMWISTNEGNISGYIRDRFHLGGNI